ncbi:hypothetical protein [Demequina sp.]|uniref:hypothetical protein n=1 Tax=Demequina sp. TaxID=2050685 RepID=UPI003D11EC4C
MNVTTHDVRYALYRAGAQDVTSSELLSLAVHREPSVRAAIASRTDCPAGALISLGHDHRPEVLLALISNPRTPSSVVRNLADHHVQRVADAAEQRLRSIYA